MSRPPPRSLRTGSPVCHRREPLFSSPVIERPAAASTGNEARFIRAPRPKDRPMPMTQYRLPWILGAALCTVACAQSPIEEQGNLRMGIVGEDADGNQYRLRDGEFDLSGASAATISTEEPVDPVDALSLVLPAGDYDITLNDGWRLERFDPATSIAIDVEAFLNSANPASASIQTDTATSVAFQFFVPDVGPVTLGEGTLDIEIDVSSDGEPCDPLIQDCAGGETCAAIGDPGAVSFVCLTSFGAAEEDPCTQANACAAGLLCAADPSCGGGRCCLAVCDTGSSDCGIFGSCNTLDPSTPDVGVCEL